MKFKMGFSLLLAMCISRVFSQDTLTVMQYNLLDYNNSPSACVPFVAKTGYIRTILEYVMPDILGVNEVYPNTNTANYLLNNALNVNGATYYKSSGYTNFAGSNLVNVVYYNSNKLFMVSNQAVQTIYRDINIVKFYYRDTNLALTHDTIYLHICVAHLKASVGYEADRNTMATDFMNVLNAVNTAGNYTFQGDFNLYTSTEPAYQTLIANTNAAMRFYDPINRPGDWNSNYSFRDIHTQSTHTAPSNCFSTGGMDDRFDFVLISNSIRLGNKKVLYVPGSYKTIGQDGYHYNDSLTDGTNNSAPSAVINALYNTSDHLPVSLKLKVTPTLTGISDEKTVSAFDVKFQNPVGDNLHLTLFSHTGEKIEIQVYDVIGNLVYEADFHSSGEVNELIMPFHYTKGIYFIKLVGTSRRILVKKIIRQ